MTVSHLCKVGQDEPDPRLGLILSQGKGRKRLLRMGGGWRSQPLWVTSVGGTHCCQRVVAGGDTS